MKGKIAMSEIVSDSYSNFLLLRQVIGVAIAKAWKDPDFSAKLVADPVQAFKDEYDYNLPFSVNLSAYLNQATWQSNIPAWVVSQLNAIKFKLPPAPTDPAQYAPALAAYERQNHLCFGLANGSVTISPRLRAALDATPGIEWLNNSPPTRDMLSGLSAAFRQAINLAWTNSQFKADFLAKPDAAILGYLHYNCPISLLVDVVDLTGQSNQSGPYGWDIASQSWNLPPNDINFGVPDAPAEASQTEAALGRYFNASVCFMYCCC